MARILVIDDDSFFRDLARFVLNRAGHDVDEAEDGAAGILRMGRGDIDLVLVDMHMPGSDGAGVVAGLAAVKGRAKIVAVTGGGAAGEDPLAMAAAAGADLGLEKRFTPEELVRAVEGLLGG